MITNSEACAAAYLGQMSTVIGLPLSLPVPDYLMTIAPQESKGCLSPFSKCTPQNTCIYIEREKQQEQRDCSVNVLISWMAGWF